MKQGSRANFVLSSLYHKLRPQAFLLNKLGYELLPIASKCFWKASILVCGGARYRLLIAPLVLWEA